MNKLPEKPSVTKSMLMIFSRYRIKQLLSKQSVAQLVAVGVVAVAVAACGGGEEKNIPTRTPVPTWTATSQAGEVSQPDQAPQPDVVTPEPPVAVQEATPTAVVEETPSPLPTESPVATEEATATVEPTSAPSFAFDLETAEKFPTESLAPNMVRVYLYVSDADDFGLAGYKLSVSHDEKPLAVDAISEDGLPTLTRDAVGPFSRFTNLNAVFVESQSGRWTIQLLDPNGSPVGPPASFELTADEATRELYVRYRLK